MDLGIDTGGYVEVDGTMSPGVTLRLGYAESRQYLSPTGDYNGDNPADARPGRDFSRTDVITSLQGGRWTSPAIRGAERWILLQPQGRGSLRLTRVGVRVAHFAPTARDYAGHFLSSDAGLDRAWYSAAYTVALDTWPRRAATGGWALVDGAKRDREVFNGDLGVALTTQFDAFGAGAERTGSSLYAFACYQNPNGYIAEAVPIDYGCPPRHPSPPTYQPTDPGNVTGSTVILPEYTAWYVVNAETYRLYTGDDATVRTMLPSLRRAVRYLDSQVSGGLLTVTGHKFNWHPPDDAIGASSFSNELYAAALASMANLEQAVGQRPAAAATLRRRERAIETAIVRRLWDPRAGAFLLNSSDPARLHGQDGNVGASALDVVRAPYAQRALAYVSTHLWTPLGTATAETSGDPYMRRFISPFVTSLEVRARMRIGDVDGAEFLIRRTFATLAGRDPGTVWESVGTNGEPLNGGVTSLAHAWGSGSVDALSGYALGIRPIRPGFRTWMIAPKVGHLRWAQGQVPTPHGPIASRWRHLSGRTKSFELTVSAPRTTSGSIVMPTLGGVRAIAMDGRLVWLGSRPASGVRASAVKDGVAFERVTGVHTLAWVSSA